MSSPENSGAPGADAYVSNTLDHHGLVAGLVDELGLVEKIDAMIPQDLSQRQVSVGMAVKAMILIGLGFVQRAWSLTPDFFRGKPVARRLGPGITAERQGLAQPSQDYPDQQGKPTARPTARGVFQSFAGIHRLTLPSFAEVVLNLKTHHRALLALLGERDVAVYSNSG
jgi:hypothetical protein